MTDNGGQTIAKGTRPSLDQLGVSSYSWHRSNSFSKCLSRGRQGKSSSPPQPVRTTAPACDAFGLALPDTPVCRRSSITPMSPVAFDRNAWTGIRSLELIQSELHEVDIMAFLAIPSKEGLGAFHNTMRGQGRIEAAAFYAHPFINHFASVLKLGRDLAGFDGIVHGGIIAMAFDDAIAHAHFHVCRKLGTKFGFTANLEIKYKKTMPAGTGEPVVIHVRVDKVCSGKMRFTAAATDAPGTTLYAKASALFVIPRAGKESPVQ